MKVKLQRGFSLVEVILYVIILSILLIGVVQINIIIKLSQVRFQSERKVHSDVSTLLNNINFLVKNSSGYASDDTGPCVDFSGAQGPSTYYLSLYYNTSTSANILPSECSGKGNSTASSTAVKLYWKSTLDRGIWMDCYQGFVNENSSNCTTIQGDGDIAIRMTSGRATSVYDGGLLFATSTSGSSTILETTLTIGITHSSINAYQATTTASSSVAFRVDVGDDVAPTEAVCGDGDAEGDEACDSTISSVCSEDGSYYSGGFDGGSGSCSSSYSCKADCSGCYTELQCTGQQCGNGSKEGTEICDSGQVSECGDSAGYYYDTYEGPDYACNSTCSASIDQATCNGPVCGDGVKEGSEVCDYSGSLCVGTGFRSYYQSPVGCGAGDDYGCKNDCTDCATQFECTGI